MSAAENSPNIFDSLPKAALAVGVVSLALCIVAGLHNPLQFFRSYLFAFVFWIGLPIGCTALLMLHHLVGGTWGFPLRRLLESGSKTFWLMAVLVLPILFRLHLLYPWADAGKVQADPILQYKHPYLNVPFFVVRTAIYFALWLFLAFFLNRWSRQQDAAEDPGILADRQRKLSAPGLIIVVLTVTFASLDWVMSLQPGWSSTIFGLIFMVTQALAAMSLVTVVVIGLLDRQLFEGLVSPRVLNDYGNLLLTFTMLWAYLSFSQYLIIWAGNLQDEIQWYTIRAQGKWAWVALALVFFHFAVPFVLLLLRFVKRRAQILVWVAAGLVVMSIVDIYWLTVPAFERTGPEYHLTDLLAILGIGGLWLWRFSSQVKGRPLLPVRDPRLKEVMQHAA